MSDNRRVVNDESLVVWAKRLYSDLEELHAGEVDGISITIRDKTYTIIEESYYESLEKRSELLECLDNAGVDNWDGYDYARELYNELYPEEK